jgi:hypothetical protein
LSKDLNECTNTLSSTHLKTLRKFQSKLNKELKQKNLKTVKLHAPVKPTFLEDTTLVHSH